MSKSIVYLGDTSRQTAASYLLGLLQYWGWNCHYVPSHQALSEGDLEDAPALIVISDYPAAQAAPHTLQHLGKLVEQGTGLLMVGGWESFHGAGGNWDQTPLAELLPVEMQHADDRFNCDHPAVVRCVAEHPCVASLPWNDRAPAIGGLNRVVAKANGETLLEVVHFRATCHDGGFRFEQTQISPLLVVGGAGWGRTAALMTDVAPHWVGPLVDWGPARVTAQAAGAPEIEAGNLYAQFLHQLLGWTGRLSERDT